MKISIIDLEVSNLYSITNAVKYLDYNYVVSSSKNEIDNSDCIILPGVGSFDTAMKNMKKKAAEKQKEDIRQKLQEIKLMIKARNEVN